MAETYRVGQYRYAGETNTNKLCASISKTYPGKKGSPTTLSLKPIYKETDRMVNGVPTYFQDVLLEKIKSDDSSILSTDMFFIELSLSPFSMNTKYTLKLVNHEKPYGDYEVIERFSIDEAKNSSLESVKIVLYCSNDEEFPEEKKNFKIAIVDDGDQKEFAAPIISVETFDDLENKNSINLLPSWNVDIEDSIRQQYAIGFASHYYQSVFDSILLEMEHDIEDYDIITEVTDVNQETRLVLGRFLNTADEADHMEVAIYKLEDIVASDLQGKGIIKKMGIWGRPGLPFIINGEQILIPSSGMIELEGIDITSVGAYAKDNNDRFVIDYQYVITN